MPYNSLKRYRNSMNGVPRNKEILKGKIALYDEWNAAGGWDTHPEYMKSLIDKIQRQRNYLRVKTGDEQCTYAKPRRSNSP